MTVGKQLRSTASKALSSIEQTISLISSELSKSNESQRTELLRLYQQAEMTFRDCQIEKDLLTATPKQLELIGLFVDQLQTNLNDREFKYFGAVGGNRSGKSYGHRCAFGIFVRDYAKDGDIIWCITPNEEKSIGQQREVWNILPRPCFAGREFSEENGFGGKHHIVELKFPGRKVTLKFKTEAQWISNPRSFEQEPVACLWIDESISEEAYRTLLARTIDKAAPVLLSCIPDQAWIFDEYAEAAEGSGVFYQKYDMRDNKYLPAIEIQRALDSWTEEEKQMRIFGNFRFVSGVVYKEFNREYAPAGHLCKPFKIPNSWPRWRSLDWGNSHLTVCLWGALAPTGQLFIYREYAQAQKPVQEHAANIIEMSRGEVFRKPMIVDPSIYNRNQANMRSIADEFTGFGLPCVPGVRTNMVGEPALVDRVKQWLLMRGPLGPYLQVFDTCTTLIGEFRRWKYKFDKNNKPMGSDRYEDKNNDALDALKYMIADNPTFTEQKFKIVSTIND